MTARIAESGLGDRERIICGVGAGRASSDNDHLLQAPVWLRDPLCAPWRVCSNIVWEHQRIPVIPDTRERVADPGSAFQIVSMMQGVVERGTGTAVRAVGKPIAGKTGTTNDFRDAWFVGGTADLIAGVFIGYDDPDSFGNNETGGHIAAPVFRDCMITALKDAPATAFRTPPGLRLYRVNPSTGVMAAAGASAIYEAYKPGTEPGTNRNLGLQGAPEEIPIRSTSDERPLTRYRASGAPATETGGLYCARNRGSTFGRCCSVPRILWVSISART
jgi:penicillin-binding protein 1A